MLDPRVYRAAFLPALLALIVAAFSLRERPRPLVTALATTAFDGRVAAADLRALAARFPSRRPGSAGDAGLARVVERRFVGAGFTTAVRRFAGETIDGERRLETVVGVRTGLSGRRIVVLAHRDARAGPARAELSGTAALLELARIFEGRKLSKTLVLVSTSGGSGGSAGAADFATHAGGPVDAVLVLGDVAGRAERPPFVVPWSSADAIAPPQLRRTVERALRTELGRDPGAATGAAQIARLAFPLTLGEQGPLGAHGLPAVLVQLSGERGPGREEPTDPLRLQAAGRAVLRSVTALDAAPALRDRPRADVVVRRKLLPRWAASLLVGALLLPVAAATLDALARARRRREPVGVWLRWLLAGASVPLLGALFAIALRTTGLLPASPRGPVVPTAMPLDGAAVTALVGVALVLALGWIGLRPLLLRRLAVRGDLAAPGAAVATAVALCGTCAAVWLANPYAALLLLPAAHVWTLLLLPDERPRTGLALAGIAVGIVPALLVAGYYLGALGFGPAHALWELLVLVAGGSLGLGAVLAASALAALLVAIVQIVLARRGGRAPTSATLRGPRSYAGPGSLGGTDSALRR